MVHGFLALFVNVGFSSCAAGCADYVCQKFDRKRRQISHRVQCLRPLRICGNEPIDLEDGNVIEETPGKDQRNSGVIVVRRSWGSPVESGHDVKRTARFMLVPGVTGGLAAYGYYGMVLPLIIPGDEVFFKTMFHTCGMGLGLFGVIVLNSALSGKGSAYIVGKAYQDWLPSYLATLPLWLPCYYIQFSYVPLEYQVVWHQGVGAIAKVILSYYCNRPLELKTEAAVAGKLRTDKFETEKDR